MTTAESLDALDFFKIAVSAESAAVDTRISADINQDFHEGEKQTDLI